YWPDRCHDRRRFDPPIAVECQREQELRMLAARDDRLHVVVDPLRLRHARRQAIRGRNGDGRDELREAVSTVVVEERQPRIGVVMCPERGRRVGWGCGAAGITRRCSAGNPTLDQRRSYDEPSASLWFRAEP